MCKLLKVMCKICNVQGLKFQEMVYAEKVTFQLKSPIFREKEALFAIVQGSRL
jgi:hypothetical protein